MSQPDIQSMRPPRGSPWGAGLDFCPLLPDVSCCGWSVHLHRCAGGFIAHKGPGSHHNLQSTARGTKMCVSIHLPVCTVSLALCMSKSPLCFIGGQLMIFHRILSKKHLVLRISVKYLLCVQLQLPGFFSPCIETSWER